MKRVIAFHNTTVGTTGQTLIELGVNPGDATASSNQELEILLTAESQAIRWRCDGGAASSSEGQPVAAGNSQTIVGTANVKNLSIAAQTGTATLQMTIFGGKA